MIPVAPFQARIFYSSIKFQKPSAYRASLPCTYIEKLNTLSRGSKQICNGCHLSLSSVLMNNTVNMDQIAHQLQSQPSLSKSHTTSPISCSQLIGRCNFQPALSSPFSASSFCRHSPQHQPCSATSLPPFQACPRPNLCSQLLSTALPGS